MLIGSIVAMVDGINILTYWTSCFKINDSPYVLSGQAGIGFLATVIAFLLLLFSLVLKVSMRNRRFSVTYR